MTDASKSHNPRDFYQQETQVYADFAVSSFSWEYIEKPAFDKHLTHLYNSTTKVLDLGCGSGRVVRHLIDSGIKQKNIAGIDISAEMLVLAKKNVPGVRFLEGDISEGLPLDDTFDLVTCFLTIQHLDDGQLAQVLKGVRASLSESGILFYLVAHPVRVVHGNLKEYFNIGWREQQTAWGTTMNYYHRTVSDYVTRTLQAGFRIEALDEPQVSDEGKNQKEYAKYSANPTRLVIKAKKY